MALISQPSTPRAPADSRPIRVARLPHTRDQNPYQRTLYTHLADEGISLVGDADLSRSWLKRNRRDVDVLHIHWRVDRIATEASRNQDYDDPPLPTSWTRAVAQSAIVNARLAFAQRLGYRIAWTVHEPERFDSTGDVSHRLIGRVIARRADVVFAHGEDTARYVDETLRPRAGVTSIGVLPPPPTAAGRRDAATVRADLGLDADTTLVLAFGSFRPDKQTELAIEAFKNLGDTTAVLVVAGRGSPEYTSIIEQAVGDHPRIVFRPGFMAEGDLDDLIVAADVAVLGRSARWTPSSLIHAITLETPVIAADLPVNRTHVGPGGWWFEPHDVASLTQVLRSVIDTPRAERDERGRQGAHHAQGNDWPATAARSAVALHEACASPSDAAFAATRS